ncbi:MAG: hypothetical protein V1733_07010 [bacterium]
MFHRVNSTDRQVFRKGLTLAVPVFILMLLSQGLPSCKKDPGFDSSAVTMSQLKGTWRGRMTTFKNNTRVEKTGDISLFETLGGNMLDGIFELGQINFLEGFMFQNGTLYFHLILSDSTNPQCSNWNLGGYVYLQEDNLMVLRIAGNECGPLGKQFVTYEGYLILVNPDMDPSVYYSFANTGHTWNYATTLKNGDTCTISNEIISEPSSSFYTVKETNDCGWPFGNRQFTWQVEPFRFSVLSGISTTDILYTFYLDAVVGKPYRFVSGGDTTWLTLAETDVPVNVPAGSFKCGRYAIESHLHTGGDTTSIGAIWLSKPYGFVKMNYTEPLDSTEVQSKVLKVVNF